MGRPKTKHKDMPDGMFTPNGTLWHWRGTSAATRAIAQQLFGKASASSGTANKNEARAWWAKTILPALEKDFASAEQGNTIGRLLDRWQTEELPRVEDPNTRQYYADLLVGLNRSLRHLQFARTDAEAQSQAHNDDFATRRVLQKYLRDAQEIQTFIRKDGKPQTGTRKVIANREIKLLAQIFDDADRLWSETNFNPARELRFNPERSRTHYADDNQYTKVRSAAPPILQCMMDTQLATGARPDMIRQLNLTDVTHDTLFVLPNKLRAADMPRTPEERRRLQKPYKLRNEDGTLNDLGRTIERALSLRKTQPGSNNVHLLPSQQPLFLNNKGERWTKYGHRSAWDRACEKQGIDPKTFHKHDIKAKMVSDSETIELAQERAGHTDSAITRKVYKRTQKPVIPGRIPKVGNQ
ncbi:MAG: tyrosine-type recombinase/integrase [Casimicrobium sp.]